MDARLTLLDRAIGWISPRAGLDRVRARLVLDYTARLYEGAGFGRATKGWRATGASSNAENAPALSVLRNRARDMQRNNPLVRSAIQHFAGKVVGTGITPRAQHKSARLRIKAMDAWNRFCDNCDPEGQSDFYGLQHLAAASMFRDGDVFGLWLPDEYGVPNSQLRLLEADHADPYRIEPHHQGARVISGVEVDDWGRRLGYHLFPVHPGEDGIINVRRDSRFVPGASVDHLFQTDRAGQVRGVSWLASSMLRMRGIDDVEQSTIMRKRLEACIGVIFSSPDAAGGSLPVIGEQKKDPKSGRTNESLHPGMVLRMGPGETATSFIPASSGDLVDFRRQQLYAFCASTGLAYHEITGDVSQANYSSTRAAKLAGDVVIDVVQWLVFRPRFNRKAWQRVMHREAVITGEARFLEVGAEWSPPVRPWTDPLKDIQAKILEIRAGLQTMPEALAERGWDWTTQLDEIESFMGALSAKGIVLDTDPRRVNRQGVAQTEGQAAGDIADNFSGKSQG